MAEIYGPRSSVDRFRDLWGARHGDRGTLAMAYGLFTADRIEVPEDDGGSIVVAGPEHRDRVRAWLEAFQREALPKEPVDREAIARMVDHRVARRDVGLWTDRDGRPRSMVARNRETDHAACISWVYTPPEDRGQGLGGRVTAHWSARLLGAGARAVFLYTDLANPVSNRLYPRLGFRRIGTDARVRFGGEAGTSCCFEGEDPAG